MSIDVDCTKTRAPGCEDDTPVTPAEGGTGTSTVFTEGSIVFAGPSGIYTQDNSNLFWDDANNRLGIGTAVPGAKLSINANAAAPVTPFTNTLFHINGSDGAGPRILIDSFASIPIVTGRRANGTGAAPTAVSADDILLAMNAMGYGTSAYSTGAKGSISVFAAENWTNSAQGTYIQFQTAAKLGTTVAEKMRLTDAGSLGIGITAPINNLHVHTTSGASVTNITTDAVANAALFFGNTYSGVQVWSGVGMFSSDSSLRLATGSSLSSPAITILPSNFVGIGTTTPGLLLDILATSAVPVRITSSSTNAAALNIVNSSSGGVGWSCNSVGSLASLAAVGSYVIRNTTDNINAFTIAQAGNVGIGAAATLPGSKLVVSVNSTVPQTALTDTGIHLSGGNTASSRVLIDGFAGAPIFTGRRAAGTAASPSALALDNTLVSLSGWGYGTSAYSSASRGSVNLMAGEAWTNSAQGTYLQFQTTANLGTTTSEKMRLTGAGLLGVGNTAPNRVLELSNASDPGIRMSEASSTTSYSEIYDASTTSLIIQKVTNSGAPVIDIQPLATDGTSGVVVRLFRSTSTSGTRSFRIARGDGTATLDHQLQAGTTGASYIAANGGTLAIGTSSITAGITVEIRNSNSGAESTIFNIMNPNSSSANTAVGLYLTPNANALTRSAAIKSRQATSGNRADLGFFTSDGATPVEYMQITSTGLIKLAPPTGTAIALTFQGGLGGTNYYAMDTRLNGNGLTAHTFTGDTMSIAGAASRGYNAVMVTPPQVTFTGTTNVTSGTISSTSSVKSVFFDQPTFGWNDASARSLVTAYNVVIRGAPIATNLDAGGTLVIPNSYALRIGAGSSVAGSNGSVTNAYALYVDVPTGATNNYAGYFSGKVGINALDPTTFLVIAADGVTAGTDEQITLRSARAAIVATNLIGGINFRSNDTTLTAPGTNVASIRALAEATHTATVLDTALAFNVTKNLVNTEVMRFGSKGNMIVPTTITAGGTTGNRTIDKISGTVNFAAAATAITVTNSLVTTSSIVFAVVRTNDTTATIKNVVPGAGSFVINLGAAATAETSVGFFVVN